MTGAVNGTAIAHGSDGDDYIVVTTQWSAHSLTYGGGLVIAFKDQGIRPRLVIPSFFTTFPSTNDDEAGIDMLAERTAEDVILNTGCDDMTWSGVLEDGTYAKIRPFSSNTEKKAADLAASLIDYKVEDLPTIKEVGASKFIVENLVQDDQGEWYLPTAAVKPAVATSSRLAIPDWVDWYPSGSGSGTVGAGGSADWTFQMDLTKMNKLGVNVFYVELSTSDPDYNPELGPSVPQGVQAELAFSAPYMYCATTIVEGLYFGDYGIMWSNNIGYLGDGDYSLEFSLTGSDDPMFAGTMFYCNDMPSCAWNPIAGDGTWNPLTDGGFLYGFYPEGDDCGGCETDTDLPVEYTTDGGLNYVTLVGDICTWAMVDSGQDMGYYPNQDGPSMGLLVKYREIGVYGADFGNFKLTIQDINNRNADPINGLYYGAFVDWDVSSADEGDGDCDKGYIYQYGPSGDVYGFIGLPSAGSFWPDDTPTDPFYNGHILHSADDYWDNEQYDSLYVWCDGYAEGSITIHPVETAGTDRAMTFAFGKCDLGDQGVHSFGFATFGIIGSWSTSDLDYLTELANKLSGFGRGDINGDGVIDLRDLVRLANFVRDDVNPGPVPFLHIGDVNCDDVVDGGDCAYMAAYFFNGGTPPHSEFVM